MGKNLRLIGTTIYDDSVAPAFCDVFEKAIPTTEIDYIDWLLEIINKHKVDLIIPGIEADLYKWTENIQVLERSGVKILTNNLSLVNLCKDKWEFFQEVSKFDTKYLIPTSTESDYKSIVANYGLPFLLKPKRGFASKGIVKVSNEAEFNAHKNNISDKEIIIPLFDFNIIYKIAKDLENADSKELKITFNQIIALLNQFVSPMNINQDMVKEINRLIISQLNKLKEKIKSAYPDHSNSRHVKESNIINGIESKIKYIGGSYPNTNRFIYIELLIANILEDTDPNNKILKDNIDNLTLFFPSPYNEQNNTIKLDMEYKFYFYKVQYLINFLHDPSNPLKINPYFTN